MKYIQLAFLSLFIFSFAVVKAQQNHFIYIQTENKQPFYVKLDKKLYSSSASGYLVIPKLKDGTYNLAIGFPKSEYKEQNMACAVNNNDHGYLLKDFGDKRWGLFNLQTLAVQMASDSVKAAGVVVVNKTDAFSNMLSNVVNDSTIRQTETVKEVKAPPVKEEEKAVTATAIEKDTLQKAVAVESPKEDLKVAEAKETSTDSVVKKGIETEIVKSNPFVENESRSAITRSLINKNADGTEMVFIDESNGKKDTVRVFIPADDNTAVAGETKPVEKEKPKEEEKQAPVKQEEKTNNTRFLEIELPAPAVQHASETKPVENKIADTKITDTKIAETKVAENKDTVTAAAVNVAEKPAVPVIQKAAMINSDCKSFATDEDFLKLRKKMAAENNDDNMLVLAKKIFKTKCFTVEQIKNLSVLFLKDAGKYAFFDMAYPFAADSPNYGTLQHQLSDSYYITRFQVMIRH